ncbi:FmdB family zinc ribbon protein [Candidatus Desulforudis audaxviator]|uniref:Putative regulatory protein, FmdB family n=1 Tax=Desulforudis audaxviator (strain MP104C) TaxID=477974 RepID=B1I357_DESAP|nr:zinc ribbon domain-containing protein [Candidatus Desulforudis audaxviator]ACA59433.1 putative regulatory protein, FmdB family [Candidatus Desulforudis audaxviator MP104C]AZK59415.1 hypothetical protein Daudx_0862 [Candidatus Desulforudis audaxviator]
MPIYDFRCRNCGHQFTVLIQLSEKDGVHCPRCRSRNIRQIISPFSLFGRKPSRDKCGSGGAVGGG